MLVAVYLAPIVAANLLAARFGPSATPFIAFALIGLDLTARDRLHEQWQGRALWARMLRLIAAGSLLTWIVNYNAGPIALASFVAFVSASVADTLVYDALRRWPWLAKTNASNVVSAAVDSIIFPTVAFGALMPGIILAQFAAKVAGGAFWSLILRKRERAPRLAVEG